ncbi:hypothetical protein [Adlercreutzia sp. ZJ154]|nr:hypothetical protein [Adlercreutzia sp. ZJ154]
MRFEPNDAGAVEFCGTFELNDAGMVEFCGTVKLDVAAWCRSATL